MQKDKSTRYMITIIVIAIVLHVWLQNNLFSFFLAPIALATIFAYARKLPSMAVPLLVILSELFSTLPPGVITLVILVPFGMKYVLSRVEMNVTISFYLAIVGIVAIQLFVMTFIDSMFFLRIPDMSLDMMSKTIPYYQLGISLFVTGTITYVMALAYHELSPAQ